MSKFQLPVLSPEAIAVPLGIRWHQQSVMVCFARLLDMFSITNDTAIIMTIGKPTEGKGLIFSQIRPPDLPPPP